MSICIISDHIIMLRQNFIIILSILIKYSLKLKGGFSPQSPHPRSAPALHLNTAFHMLLFYCFFADYLHFTGNRSTDRDTLIEQSLNLIQQSERLIYSNKTANSRA